MKCVCCEKELIFVDKGMFPIIDECCGYEYRKDGCISFYSTFTGYKALFFIDPKNISTFIISWTKLKNFEFTLHYPFNFKDKDSHIKRIEELMVFI